MTSLTHVLITLCVLLIPPSLHALTTDTVFDLSGPVIQVKSASVNQKYINTMCTHRGKRYIGGFFNRFGTHFAKSFVQLSETDEVEFAGEVGRRSLLEDTQREPDADYSSRVSSLACPEDEDYIYLGGSFSHVTNNYEEDSGNLAHYYKNGDHSKREVIEVNNIARFNVNTREFSSIVSSVDPALSSFVGIRNFAANNTLVRRIECTGNKTAGVGRSCSTMYVGGIFTHAFGMEVKGYGILQRQVPSDMNSYAAVELSDIAMNSGITLTTLEIDPPAALSRSVYGGFFSPVSDDDSLLPLAVWLSVNGAGSRCIVGQDMLASPTCWGPAPPQYCCEPIWGEVAATLKVSDDEILLGGSFEKGGILNGDGTSMNFGYQNLVAIPIPSIDLTSPIAALNGVIATQMAARPKGISGGPSGKVLSLDCAVRDASGRCTKVLVAGGFNSWENFVLDPLTGKELKVTAQYCNQSALVLDWNPTASKYEPSPLLTDIGSRGQHIQHSTNLAYDSSKTYVNTIHHSANNTYLGGFFAKFNNIVRFNATHNELLGVPANLASLLPNSQGTEVLPNDRYSGNFEGNDGAEYDFSYSDWYNCSESLTASGSGEVSYFGGSFCCPYGHYCPSMLMDVECPRNWGYFCTQDKVGICPEGYFCLLPGIQLICPVGSVCPEGASLPRFCFPWEICTEEGMREPATESGLIFAAIIIFIVSFGSISILSWKNRQKRLLHEKIERQFNLRYNAFNNRPKTDNSSSKSAKNTKKQAASYSDEGLAGVEMAGTDGKHISITKAQKAEIEMQEREIRQRGLFGLKSGKKMASSISSGGSGQNPMLKGMDSSGSFKYEENPMGKAPEQWKTLKKMIGSAKNLMSSVRAVEGDDTDTRGKRCNSVAPNSNNLIDIRFEKLNVVLRSGKKILNNLNGEFKSGTMTAIMGPSGCGKSTTMSALTNRIKDGGKVLGDIYINGEKKNVMTIQHICGFVPQDDIMHRDLTVRENLRYYAKLKGDPYMSSIQRRSFTNEVIDILGLAHVQHEKIGDELTRGISGGQRKRVNIGIELMGSPLVLYLDEPTSGLDATTTIDLISSLDRLAKLGMTVVMVIHQPRIEALLLIHNLVLLQKGGFPVYVGKTSGALNYFEQYLKIPLPNQTSAADFFLDVITANKKTKHGDVAQSWRHYEENVLKEEKRVVDPTLAGREIPVPNTPGRMEQLWIFTNRSITQISGNRRSLMVDAFLLVFAGIVSGFSSTDEIIVAQFTATNNGLLAIISSLRCFGPETAIFRREMHSGISSFSYFFGKVLAAWPMILINPLFYLSTFYRIANPQVEFIVMYLVIVCINLSGTGLGYFISLAIPEKNSQLAAVVFGLVAIMTGGLNPTLTSLRGNVAGRLMSMLTYGPYSMGALQLAALLNADAFKAEMPMKLQFYNEKGYIDDIDATKIFNDDDVEAATEKIDEQVILDCIFMVKQYIFYVLATFALTKFYAMEENGGCVNSLMNTKMILLVRKFFAELVYGISSKEWDFSKNGVRFRTGGSSNNSLSELSISDVLPAAVPPPPPQPILKAKKSSHKGDWEVWTDNFSGQPYYHNTKTGVTQWDKPADA